METTIEATTADLSLEAAPQMTPQAILEQYIRAANEMKKLEKLIGKKGTLKPIVEVLRNGQAKAVFVGKFKGEKGEYIIANIESHNTTANVDAIKVLLLAKTITQAQYDAIVTTTPYDYNKVSFSPGLS
jgi:hypothetical protein